MSTTLVQAAAAGVRTFSTDPLVRTCTERLAPLMRTWFVERGCAVGEVSYHQDYLLNGNQGTQFVFAEIRTPTGLPVRVACEFLAQAQGESLQAWLRVRAAAGNGWVIVDSPLVELRYGDHPGEYKMALLSQRLITLLAEVRFSTMLNNLIDEVEVSALA